MRTTQIQPGYEFLDNTDGMLIEAGGMTFGPHIGELANHTNRLAIIRGMSMDTLTHEVGMRRFLTGKAPAGLQARGSSAATWLASHYGGYEPIPNLAVQVESYNEERPNYATGSGVNSVGFDSCPATCRAELTAAHQPTNFKSNARCSPLPSRSEVRPLALSRGLTTEGARDGHGRSCGTVRFPPQYSRNGRHSWILRI